jgi:ribose transport system substrate-binding protein
VFERNAGVFTDLTADGAPDDGAGTLTRGDLLKRSAVAGLALTAAGGITAAGASAASAGVAAADKAKDLYVVVGILTTASYWNGPKAALKVAAKKMGVNTLFTGTTGLNDADIVKIVEQILPRKPKGLMIEPADPHAVQDVIGKARARGIPSMIVNAADVPGGTQVGYLGFSRQSAAALAADVVAKNVKGKGGTVAALVFDASAVAMVDALAGFKAELKKKRPDLKVIEAVDKADAGYATTLCSQLITAHHDLKAIASLDTVGGQAAANAIKAARKKDIVVVAGGLDESQTQYWPLIESGYVTAGILSSSFEQFYVSMQYLTNLNSRVIDGINWQKHPEIRVVPEYTDLGSFVIDKKNLSVVKNLKLA